MSKDHYISQFYLKQFSSRKDRRVWVWDISNKYDNSPKERYITSICFKKWLFTRIKNGKLDERLEKRFWGRETEINDFITKLNNKAQDIKLKNIKNIVLSIETQNNIRHNCIQFTNFQLKRCLPTMPSLEKHTIELCAQIDNILNSAWYDIEPMKASDITFEMTRFLFLKSSLIENLEDKNFEIIFNSNKDNFFCLSDFPIYISNQTKDGLSELVMPLWPNICIKFRWNSWLFNTSLMSNKKEILKLNEKIVTNSNRYIIWFKRSGCIKLMEIKSRCKLKRNFQVDFSAIKYNTQEIIDRHIQAITK